MVQNRIVQEISPIQSDVIKNVQLETLYRLENAG